MIEDNALEMILKKSLIETSPNRGNLSDEDSPKTIQCLQTPNSNIISTRKKSTEQNNIVDSDKSKLKKNMYLSYFSSMSIKKRPKKENITISSLLKACDPIKSSLEKQGISLLQLIDDKISIRKGKKIVMVKDLVSALVKLIKFSHSELENMFKDIIEEEGYIVVSKLMSFFNLKDPENEEESFEEPNKKILPSDNDEEFQEEIRKLPEESKDIIKSLLNYMSKANKDLISIFKKGIYQQAIAMADGEIVLDAIDAKDFYNTLKSLAIVRKENKELSTLLRIHEEYPDIFLIKKLIKLIKSTIHKRKSI